MADSTILELPSTVVSRFHGASRAPIKPNWGTSPEHTYLGDRIYIKIPNSDPSKDPDHISTATFMFKLNDYDPTLNGQALTYGQINAMAGDFYGTYEPISGREDSKHPDHPDEAERIRRFLKAWYLLAKEPKSVQETINILKDEDKFEASALQQWAQYIKEHKLQPSWIYAKETLGDTFQGLIDETSKWAADTNSRSKANGYDDDYPGYLGLLSINFDHFGADADTAYAAGHKAALTVAANGKDDVRQLKLAYAMNAFADHYLEDSFSAGHIRTPRRVLHGGSVFGSSTLKWPVRDLCANKMHDEDSALGVKVRNKKNDEWVCYGDDYMKDDIAKDNLKHCLDAVQASANEIYDAFVSHNVKAVDEFEALKIVPTIESAAEVHEDMLAPLFKVKAGVVYRRSKWIWWLGKYDLARRKWSDDSYVSQNDVELVTTLGFLIESGYWNYPLQYDQASPDTKGPTEPKA